MIFMLPPGDYFKAFQEFGGSRPAVRFDQSDHHIDTFRLQPVCLLQHLIGFPDTGGISKVDLQTSTLGQADHS